MCKYYRAHDIDWAYCELHDEYMYVDRYGENLYHPCNECEDCEDM